MNFLEIIYIVSYKSNAITIYKSYSIMMTGREGKRDTFRPEEQLKND